MNTDIKIKKSVDNLSLQYLIREPKTAIQKRKAIILLHGVGSNEQDLFGLADHLPDDFFIISARGQFELGSGRFAWYNVDFSTGKPVINPEQELSSRNVIRKFISEMKEKFHLEEIYIGGFSQGGIMSYSVGLGNPEEVDGVISFSGRILEDVQRSTTPANEHKDLRIFLAHGIQDNTLPIHYARQAKCWLEKAGVNLTYREYEMGHQINPEVLTDLNKWLTSNIRSVGQTSRHKK